MQTLFFFHHGNNSRGLIIAKLGPPYLWIPPICQRQHNPHFQTPICDRLWASKFKCTADCQLISLHFWLHNIRQTCNKPVECHNGNMTHDKHKKLLSVCRWCQSAGRPYRRWHTGTTISLPAAWFQWEKPTSLQLMYIDREPTRLHGNIVFWITWTWDISVLSKTDVDVSLLQATRD